MWDGAFSVVKKQSLAWQGYDIQYTRIFFFNHQKAGYKIITGFQVALKFLKKHSKWAKFLKRPLFFRIIPNFLSISRVYPVKM